MVTILNPAGTPTIIYNNAGKNIQSITANSGDAFADAVAVTHYSEFTLVLVNASGGAGSGAVSVGTDFNIGDILIVTFTGGSDVKIYGSDGTFINEAQSSTEQIQLMKTGSAVYNWVLIG